MARYLRATPSSLQFQHSYVSTLTVDDLSYSPSDIERARDDSHLVATGRRNWKTLRGKGEAVWPPNLEAALLEALEKYNPDDHKHSKCGRFPLRNKFISDYIFEVTGKRRTAKQVGSRLQQLRDTCKDDRILRLVCSRKAESGASSDSDMNFSNESSPVSASSPPFEYFDSDSHSPLTLIWISIPIRATTRTTIPPTIPFMNNTQLTPLTIRLAALEPSERHSYSDLGGLNSEVLFNSPSLLYSHTLWTVWKHGTPFPVHREIVQLNLHSSPKHSSGWNYSTKLVPGFWSMICNDPSPTQYTIIQDIYPDRQHVLDDSSTATKLSIIYNFFYPFYEMETAIKTNSESLLVDASYWAETTDDDSVWYSQRATATYNVNDYSAPHVASHQNRNVIIPYNVDANNISPPTSRAGRQRQATHDTYPTLIAPRVIRPAPELNYNYSYQPY